MKSSSKLYCKSLWTSIVTMLLIISAMVPLITEAEINSTGTYFWIDPPGNIYQTSPNNFTISIKIVSAPETFAWDLKLAFDNATLSFVEATEGNWLSSLHPTIFLATPAATANIQGWVGIGCTFQGNVTPGQTGSGTLCTVKFNVLSCGTSQLDLQDTALLDMSLVRTGYPNNDGFFACATVHDVEITGVTANGSVVNQGASVGITVTVHNGGNFTESGSVKVTARPRDAREPVVQIDVAKPFADLASDGSTNLVFTWDTTTVAGEVYDIISNATITTDNDLHDNVFIGPVVRVKCPHDIDVSDVTVLTPSVHVGYIASIKVTVVNEGQNIESFNVNVYAGASLVATVGVVNLAVDGSTSVIGNWNTTGVTPGVYVMKANATVASEKDTADNQKIDGPLKVIIDDIAILTITASTPSGKVITVTVKNSGTEWARFTVYVWAVPSGEVGSFDPDAWPVTTNAGWIGWIPIVSLAAGENLTFSTLDPYGGVPYGETGKTLYPPYTPLTPCATYYIYAVALKLYDIDDNLDNNYLGTAGTIKPRLPGDVNDSGKVTWEDLSAVGLAYGATPSSTKWNAQCDFNYSGKITWEDLSALGLKYGKFC